MYDVVVLGLGGMGSAALAHLALRGKTVLGIEQFERGHDRGSSTGETRIIRMAYYEDPAYVPLLERAYVLWGDLERATGTRLVDWCGLLMAGADGSRLLEGAAASARQYGIAVQPLTRAELQRRFPQLRVREGERAIFEPAAGMVFPEAAIAAHLAVAERAGAHTRFAARVARYAAEPAAIRVELADGTAVETQRLAICAGPWLAAAAADLQLPLVVQRNVQLWFAPLGDAYAAGRFPVFFLDRTGLPAALYGFPDRGSGIKAALHGFGPPVGPDTLDRVAHPADIEPVQRALEDWMPGAGGRCIAAKVCMYTLTPDEHFLIDRHPADPRIVIAGGFSGHGFKFCPVVGEIVADLAVDGTTRHPIGFLSANRLRGIGAAPGAV